MPSTLVRSALVLLVSTLFIGLHPSPAGADASQLCRSVSSIVLAPGDLVFAPVIAAKDIWYGMGEWDDPLALQMAAVFPGYVYLNAMQLGALSSVWWAASSSSRWDCSRYFERARRAGCSTRTPICMRCTPPSSDPVRSGSAHRTTPSTIELRQGRLQHGVGIASVEPAEPGLGPEPGPLPLCIAPGRDPDRLPGLGLRDSPF